jgi:ATP-dependent exoDNAse (exonuclease V) beta subunit
MRTFTYDEMETSQEMGLRWYHTPSGSFPSITTILGQTQSEESKKALEGWRSSLGAEKADKVSKAACDRGTNVHLMTERYLKKEEVFAPISGSKIPQEDISLFNSLKLKLNKITEVWGQEVPLFSNDLGVAGRCDCIGVYEGDPCIIDFKTSGRIKSSKDIEDYWIQCAFYLTAHNEMFGTNISKMVILMAAASGFPLVWKKDIDESTMNSLKEKVSLFYSKYL